MSGWVKLHRSLLDWEWYSDANTMRVFIHCLIKANHVDKKWRGINIKRGDFLSSYDAIAIDLNLSRQKIRTAIDKLKTTNEITTSSSAQHTVFTVCNYDKHQQLTNETTTNQPPEQPTQQPTDNQRVTTTKNDKKEKNISLVETDVSTNTIPSCPHSKIIDLYHEHLPLLPTVSKNLWTGSARAKALQARWKQSPQHQSLEFWKKYFQAINQLEWMFSGNGKGQFENWEADLGWLVNKANFEKTVDRLRNLHRSKSGERQ